MISDLCLLGFCCRKKLQFELFFPLNRAFNSFTLHMLCFSRQCFCCWCHNHIKIYSWGPSARAVTSVDSDECNINTTHWCFNLIKQINGWKEVFLSHSMWFEKKKACVRSLDRRLFPFPSLCRWFRSHMFHLT